MNCQYCNNPVPQGVPTCPSCGAPAPQPPPVQNQQQMSPPPQQPPFGQMPYGQAPYGQPYPGGMPPVFVNSYMTEAILTTLFCCMPFGIVAIIFASQVSGHLACGRVMEAQKAANNAKTWSLVSMLSSLVVGLLYMLGMCGAIL